MTWDYKNFLEENSAWVKKRFDNCLSVCDTELRDVTSGEMVGDDLADTGTILRELGHAYGVRGAYRCMLGDMSGSIDIELSTRIAHAAMQCFVKHYSSLPKGPFNQPVATADEAGLILSSFAAFSTRDEAVQVAKSMWFWARNDFIYGVETSAIFSFIYWLVGDRAGEWGAPLVDDGHIYRQIYSGNVAGESIMSAISSYHKNNSDDKDDIQFPEFLASPWRECPAEIIAFSKHAEVAIAPTPGDLLDPIWLKVRFNGGSPEWLRAIESRVSR